MDNCTDAQAESLWRNFLAVTQEMHKFLVKDDIDMFLSLLEQRLEVQKGIEALDNTTYHLTEAGRLLIQQINPINADIRCKVQVWLNKTKRNQTMAKAYDSLGFEVAGYNLNRSF